MGEKSRMNTAPELWLLWLCPKYVFGHSDARHVPRQMKLRRPRRFPPNRTGGPAPRTREETQRRDHPVTALTSPCTFGNTVTTAYHITGLGSLRVSVLRSHS